MLEPHRQDFLCLRHIKTFSTPYTCVKEPHTIYNLLELLQTGFWSRYEAWNLDSRPVDLSHVDDVHAVTFVW
jgi:hypothetical protein